MLCDCGHDSSSFTVQRGARGMKRVCRNCRNPRLRESVFNPFAALELEHVSDDMGQPLRVSSLRQLREAEKRYEFKSLVANERESDFDKPPQHRQKSLVEQMSEPYRDEEGNWHESHFLYPEIARELAAEMVLEGEE